MILEAATATAEPHPGFLEGVRELVRPPRHAAGLRRDDHRVPLVAAAARSPSTASPRTCRAGARRWATASRSSALAGRARVDGARRPRHRRATGSSCCPPRTARRRRAWRRSARSPRPTGRPIPIGTMERAGPRRWPTGRRGRGREAGVERARDGHRAPVVPGVRAPAIADGAPSQAYRTLFLQELLRRGVLGQSFVTRRRTPTPTSPHASPPCAARARLSAGASNGGTVDGFLHGRPGGAGACGRSAAPRRIEEV